MHDNDYNIRERKRGRNSFNKDYNNSDCILDEIENGANLMNNKARKSNNCKYLCIFLIFSLFLFLLPIIPYIRFNKFKTFSNTIKLPNRVALEENLKENNLLQNVEYIGKGKLYGPETIIFINDTMYSGSLHGALVRWDTFNNPHTVVQIGGEHIATCIGSPYAIKNCGRILGIRYKAPNYVYIVDTYHGIYKYDLVTYDKTLILSNNDRRFGDRPMKFPNDVDVDDDGNVYFTDSSSEHDIDQGLNLVFEGSALGRLFSFNEHTNELKLLIDNMHFANGIQLTPNKDAILVSEFGLYRILKYYIKGENAGKTEVFLNLPGSADNIRITEFNTLMIPMMFVRSPYITVSTFIEFFSPHPLLKTMINSILDIPNLMLRIPKYYLIAEYDFDGKPIRSWHDTTGQYINFPSCAILHKKKLYIGSFAADYTAVINY